MLTPTQIAGIKEYATSNRDEIVAVYLYGSVAERADNALSDVDLAILLRERLKRDAVDIERDAAVAFQRLFEREVDVRALTKETGLPFLGKIFRRGVCIANTDEEYATDFRAVMIPRILDFEYFLTRHHFAYDNNATTF